MGDEATPPQIPAPFPARIIRGVDANGTHVEIHSPGNQAAVDAAKVAAAPWHKKNNQALDFITNAVGDDLLYLVKHANYAAEAWASLRVALQPSNSIRALAIKQRIISYMCEPGFNTATWLDDCQQMYDELYNMDSESMSDVEFTKTLLNNMPIDSNWRNFLSGLRQEYSKRTVHPGSIEVINTICDEYWIQNRNDPQSYGTAFSAKLNVQSAKRRIGDDGRGALGDNKRAHTQGTDQQPWKDKNKLRCTVKDCESPTRHEAPDCFVYEGGKQGQYPHWYRGPRDIHLPKAQREPRKTKPRVSQADALQTSQTPQPLSVAPISTDSIDLNSVSENNVWSLHTDTVEDELPDVVVCSMPITDSNIPCSDACYHDSGANRHVFHNHDIFSDYECIKPITVQAFGKGLTTQAIG